MRFIRRLRKRSLAKASILVFGSALSASCSNDDDTNDLADAASDSAVAPVDRADVTTPSFDAGPIDAAPPRIECASSPCATALVTTLGGYYRGANGQGFCALLQDRTVACWGANVSGQLGRGAEGGTVDSSSTPARVVSLEGVVDLSHTCAVDKDGATWCWGTGPFLRPSSDPSNPTTTERTPVKLELPPATHVGVGPLVACIATGDGVLCWGSNHAGQIGPFDTTTRGGWYTPQKLELARGAPIRHIAIGAATLIVREDGTTLTLGENPPLGRVSSMSADPYAASLPLDGVLAVDISVDNACAAAGGTGYCWGAPMPGATDRLTRAYPTPVVTPEPIVEIATTQALLYSNDGMVAPYRWCAVSVSGAVYCWGLNENGQAGNGRKEFVYDPVKVAGLPERAVSVKTTRSTTCALLRNGKIYCWGGNFDGQLGNGKNKGVALVPEEVVLP